MSSIDHLTNWLNDGERDSLDLRSVEQLLGLEGPTREQLEARQIQAAIRANPELSDKDFRAVVVEKLRAIEPGTLTTPTEMAGAITRVVNDLKQEVREMDFEDRDEATWHFRFELEDLVMAREARDQEAVNSMIAIAGEEMRSWSIDNGIALDEDMFFGAAALLQAAGDRGIKMSAGESLDAVVRLMDESERIAEATDPETNIFAVAEAAKHGTIFEDVEFVSDEAAADLKYVLTGERSEVTSRGEPDPFSEAFDQFAIDDSGEMYERTELGAALAEFQTEMTAGVKSGLEAKANEKADRAAAAGREMRGESQTLSEWLTDEGVEVEG